MIIQIKGSLMERKASALNDLSRRKEENPFTLILLSDFSSNLIFHGNSFWITFLLMRLNLSFCFITFIFLIVIRCLHLKFGSLFDKNWLYSDFWLTFQTLWIDVRGPFSSTRNKLHDKFMFRCQWNTCWSTDWWRCYDDYEVSWRSVKDVSKVISRKMMASTSSNTTETWNMTAS
jgi:hypothetical protein